MKAMYTMIVLATVLAATPVLADQEGYFFGGYPDAADSIKQPKSRMNFNTSSRHMADDEAFPQGRNNVDTDVPVSRATTNKPKKSICVGTDCGCGSGKKR